jgi:hypothetical protein
MPDTDKILPRTKHDWIVVARNVILLLSMAGAAYGGTTAANESRLDRVEAKVERIEAAIDRLLDSTRARNDTEEKP